MKKLMIIFLIIFFIGIASAQENKIHKNVLENLSSSNEKIDVLIKLNDSLKINSYLEKDNLLKSNRTYKNYIQKKVSLNEINELLKRKEVIEIKKIPKIKAFLEETSEIIYSNKAHKLVYSGLNFTGKNIKVCILDSWINFSHPDLVGRNESCVIDCFDKECIENCSLTGSDEHGTHVAGIVAANGNLKGIAPNVNLIGVKVLDSSGGSGNSLDLSRAIDYCVNENVDVISMSLGTSVLYDEECGSLMDPWTDSINNAFANNISVVAASGNSGSSSEISSPACIGNVTAVGSVYDKNIGGVQWFFSGGDSCIDSETFADKIVCHTNRNNLLDFLAPGAILNSTKISGGYKEKGGTSMATPVVSGAIAVLKQVLELTNQTKNPNEIKNIFNNSGKKIYDENSGLNFSRINLYEAIISVDNINPNVSLESPEDNSTNISYDYNFSCNVNDWKLSNLSFYLWNSTGLLYNKTKIVSGNFNSSIFNYSFSEEGQYYWNCLAYDSNGNSDFAVSNFSLRIEGLEIFLENPSNNYYTNISENNFSCYVNSSNELSNLSFYLWNSTGLLYNKTKIVSGNFNSSIFNYSFSEEGQYYWNCLAYDSLLNNSFANSNNSFFYDISNPLLNLISPDNSQNFDSGEITFRYNVSDNFNNSNCSLYVNNGIVLTNESVDNLSFFSYSLSENSNWYILCKDYSGNYNKSEIREIIINKNKQIISSRSSGGGGGFSDSPKIYNASLEEISSKKGYTKNLEKKDKIVFFDKKNNKHNLVLNEINEYSVNLTIYSKPINILLGVGQSIKLNLSSKDYYDVFIKLNKLKDNEAELTIQTISEKIFKIKNNSNENKSKNISEKSESEIPRNLENLRDLKIKLYILSLIIIFLIIVILIREKKYIEELIKEMHLEKIREVFEKEIKPNKKGSKH